MSHLVFVYGSLKAGFHNASLLRTATMVGKAVTVSRYYTMLSTGNFPVVMHTHDARVSKRGSVTGELYEVDDATFAALDRLESNGYMYKRRQIFVRLDMPDPFGDGGGGLSQPINNRMIKCWTYIGVLPFWKRTSYLARIAPSAANTLTWERRPYD